MSAEPESVQQARQQVNRLVEEIARLTESSLGPQEYFAEFLSRALTAIAAPAGAIWIRTAQGNLQLQYQINFREIGLDQNEGAQESHHELLRQAIAQGRALTVPPHSGPGTLEGKPAPANMTRLYVLLIPIVIEKQVAGLIEVWQEPDRGAAAMEGFKRFLADLSSFVSAYLRNTQLRQMLGQQQVWLQLEAYTRSIHSSLNPREVGYAIVNEARRLLSCDRVSIAIRLGSATRVEAISGADVIEKRSALVQTMKALFDSVLVWGEKLVFAGTKDDSLPPRVLAALDAYLAESNSKLLILLPLKDDREKDSKRPCRTALLVECFEPNVTADQLNARLDILSKHAAPAMYNAVELRRLPFRWLLQPLANIKDSLRGNRGAIAAAIAGGIAFLILVLIAVPYPLRMEAKGKLMPKERQTVYPLVTGKVTNVFVKSGDRVTKGEDLLSLHDVEKEQELQALASTISQAEAVCQLLTEQLSKSKSESEQQDLQMNLIKKRTEKEAAQGKYNILLRMVRTPEEAKISAPINGNVVTFDVHDRLQGNLVNPKDPLMQIAQFEGPWEVELRIPEGHVGHIREALARADGAPLAVDLLVTSYHDHTKTFRGWLTREGLCGKVEMENNEPVLNARVQIDQELHDVLHHWEGGNVPVGAEVRAKVRCGNRSVGYVWFYELWEFVFERVLF